MYYFIIKLFGIYLPAGSSQTQKLFFYVGLVSLIAFISFLYLLLYIIAILYLNKQIESSNSRFLRVMSYFKHAGSAALFTDCAIILVSLALLMLVGFTEAFSI